MKRGPQRNHLAPPFRTRRPPSWTATLVAVTTSSAFHKTYFTLPAKVGLLPSMFAPAFSSTLALERR